MNSLIYSAHLYGDPLQPRQWSTCWAFISRYLLMSKGPSWPHSLVGEGETESNMKETKQAVMKQKKEACPRQGTESLGRASVAGTHEGPVEAGWRED